MCPSWKATVTICGLSKMYGKLGKQNMVLICLTTCRISWQTLTSFRNTNDLKQALRGDEHATLTNIRSICWKVRAQTIRTMWLHLTEILQVFLLFQNADQSSWLQTLVDSRSAYDSLRARFLRAIDNPDEVDSDIDPLSEHEEVRWSFSHSHGSSD